MIKAMFLISTFALSCFFVHDLRAELVANVDTPVFEQEAPAPIEAILKPLMNDQLISGYHLSVYKNHQQVLNLSEGFADEDAGIESSEKVLYAIASMTKPIVSLATLILADRDVLDLKDPVRKFIPEFADLLVVEDGDYDNPAEALARDITIHDLLTHTSGLTYSQDITGREEIAQLYAELDILSIDGMFRSRLGNLDDHIQELVQLPRRSPRRTASLNSSVREHPPLCKKHQQHHEHNLSSRSSSRSLSCLSASRTAFPRICEAVRGPT